MLAIVKRIVVAVRAVWTHSQTEQGWKSHFDLHQIIVHYQGDMPNLEKKTTDSFPLAIEIYFPYVLTIGDFHSYICLTCYKDDLLMQVC